MFGKYKASVQAIFKSLNDQRREREEIYTQLRLGSTGSPLSSTRFGTLRENIFRFGASRPASETILGGAGKQREPRMSPEPRSALAFGMRRPESDRRSLNVEWHSPYTEAERTYFWTRLRAVQNRDPALWRLDDFGNLLFWSDYGNRDSPFGWEIDHVVPKELKGSSYPSNLRALSWKANVNRSR